MGTPLVVSDLGNLAEIVLSPPDVDFARRTGWRVPAGDAKALARAAHAIKGASASIQARAASRAAAALESAARGGDGAGLDALARGLQHEIGRAVDYLENAA